MNPIQALYAKLYDSATPEEERRDISMRLAMIHQGNGFDLDSLLDTNNEEEEES